MVHPNVGAILPVDYGSEAVTNRMLQDYLIEQGYPLEHVIHHFLSVQGGFDANLEKGGAILSDWLNRVDAMERTKTSPSRTSRLRFSAGDRTHSLGCRATRSPRMSPKRSFATAGQPTSRKPTNSWARNAMCSRMSRIWRRHRCFWTRLSDSKSAPVGTVIPPKGNPSGGNNFRGLYNIAIKSIGAAMKRAPGRLLGACNRL